MATVHILSGSCWRPKYLLFAMVGLMMLTVIYRDRVLANPYAPIWEHYRYFKWWLLPHGFAGSLALFLGRCSSPTNCGGDFFLGTESLGEFTSAELRSRFQSASGLNTSNTFTRSLRCGF